MQKTITEAIDCPQRTSSESERYVGVQTFIGMTENNLAEVIFTKDSLFELILSPSNLNLAYKRVKANGGVGGVDNMSTSDLLSYLYLHKEDLITSLGDGSYRPSPVLRVEISKEHGKLRPLGIPIVVDRLIQQSIAQVLSPIYELEFSDNSYGFRPKRGAHQALRKSLNYINAGYKYAVDLDLEKFFDTVNHSKLLEILSRKIKDGRVISLIHKYMKSGIVIGNKFEKSTQGVPQGGPLSPLLSNIMLNELDKELEQRNHPFVRYADDMMIFCKSKRAAERTKTSIIKFIESTLYLKVNTEKTNVGTVSYGMKFLGYSFYFTKGLCHLRVHPRSISKMKLRLKELTSRSNGWGYERRKTKLREFITGWVEYFKLADMKSKLQEIDSWLRRRIRMCIWKSWKRVRTKFKNLVKCGIEQYQAWQWANTRKSYWHTSNSWILSRAVDNEKLRITGYPTLMDCYRKYYRR